MSRVTSKYCKGCKDRKENCHAKCFAYNVDLAKRKMEKEKLDEQKRKHMDLVGYSVSKIDKFNRRYGR